MKEYFISSINWMPREKGGREKIPPKGTRYCPMIRLCNNAKSEDWSIDFICPDFEKTDIIKFKFLVDDAPKGGVEIDKRYAIYEGNRLVANIKILKIISH